MVIGCGGGALGAGMVLGVASTLSIGPNNLMLVREGLMRGRVGLVATLVFASNLVLLLTAFFLADTIEAGLSPYRVTLTWLGFAAVSSFAFMSLRASYKSANEPVAASGRGETVDACLRRVLTVVWLNPLTFIELLLVPASVSGNFADDALRLQFILSIVFVTAIACYGYSYGAGCFASVFKHRRSLQVFDFTSGLLLTGVALFMAVGLLTQ